MRKNYRNWTTEEELLILYLMGSYESSIRPLTYPIPSGIGSAWGSYTGLVSFSTNLITSWGFASVVKVKSHKSGPLQCDQIGRFLKVLADKDSIKSVQICLGNFWTNAKSNIFHVKLLWLLFGKLSEKIGLLFNSASGHSGSATTFGRCVAVFVVTAAANVGNVLDVRVVLIQVSRHRLPTPSSPSWTFCH